MDLERADLVSKKIYSDKPPRAEYNMWHLWQKEHEVIIKELGQWTESGRRVHPQAWRRPCVMAAPKKISAAFGIVCPVL